MASLAAYNKAQLIELVEQYRTQIDDLTVANEALASGIDNAGPQDEDAVSALSHVPADMLVTGMLVACKPATFSKGPKAGQVVDGLHKFAISTSVAYTNGKDAEGEYIWERVKNYKTVWFICDEQLAVEINALLESNSWTLVRCWYRYSTRAKNVVDVKQVDYKTKAVRTDDNGVPLLRKALANPADLKGLRIDVVKSAPKGETTDDNDVM